MEGGPGQRTKRTYAAGLLHAAVFNFARWQVDRLSPTGRQGSLHIWVAATNHRSSPRQITHGSEEDSVSFLPNDDLIVRVSEGPSNFLYRMKLDGTKQKKITEAKVFDLAEVSPDGRWAVAAALGPDEEHPYAIVAFPVGSGAPVTICMALCRPRWDAQGKVLFVGFAQQAEQVNYGLPVHAGLGLPALPAGGLSGGTDASQIKGVTIVHQRVSSALNSSVYAFVRSTTRRNIYRIPLQ